MLAATACRSPHGGRGLKFSCTLGNANSTIKSIPARGSWIEIPFASRMDCSIAGRYPHGGRGLKCNGGAVTWVADRSIPARGSWIEILLDRCGRVGYPCRFAAGMDKRGPSAFGRFLFSSLSGEGGYMDLQKRTCPLFLCEEKSTALFLSILNTEFAPCEKARDMVQFFCSSMLDKRMLSCRISAGRRMCPCRSQTENPALARCAAGLA